MTWWSGAVTAVHREWKKTFFPGITFALFSFANLFIIGFYIFPSISFVYNNLMAVISTYLHIHPSGRAVASQKKRFLCWHSWCNTFIEISKTIIFGNVLDECKDPVHVLSTEFSTYFRSHVCYCCFLCFRYFRPLFLRKMLAWLFFFQACSLAGRRILRCDWTALNSPLTSSVVGFQSFLGHEGW